MEALARVIEPLSHSVALVVIPIGADQEENTAAVVAADVGRAISRRGLTPTSLRDLIRHVLDDEPAPASAQRTATTSTPCPHPKPSSPSSRPSRRSDGGLTTMRKRRLRRRREERTRSLPAARRP